MVLPPSQYQASRELDEICDLRVSIANGDYIDSDPWGRGKAPSLRFPSRAAAERSLSALHQSAAAAPTARAITSSAYVSRSPVPAIAAAAPRRTLRPSRLGRQGSAIATAPTAGAILPYTQPPQPPQHLQLRDSSRDSTSLYEASDVTAPPPHRALPHVPSGFTRDVASSDKSSEPPSFANLRDLSMASTNFGHSSSGMRRPRAGKENNKVGGAPEKRAALADYLELSEEALIQRVFDDDNEPASVPGAGSVASVPQSPYNQNRIKRWMSKKSSQNLDTAPSSRGSEIGETLQRKSSSKKVRDSLSRLLALDSAPPAGKEDISQPLTPSGPISGRSLEAPSAASLEEETPPPTAVYEMVTLKTNIPDRPRTTEAQPYEDAIEFFDDLGDVAIGDADIEGGLVEDYEEEVIVRSNGRVRPQLKEHLITSIKSYHGPEDYDDDDYGDGEYSDDNESSTTTEKSFTISNGKQNALRSEPVFEESDISHSFSQPPSSTH